MLKWLLPKSTDFFALFELHAMESIAAARELYSSLKGEGDASEHANRLRMIEHAADEITHRCVEALHKTFITPFPREQIHQLISRLDDIVDLIEEVQTCLSLYKLHVITPEAMKMGSLLVTATEELDRALKGLRHLKNTEEMRKIFARINEIENEADVVVQGAIGRLFDEELDPRLIIKWKEVYDHLEDAIDSCKDVSHIIEGVILESV